jgi:hypothetical protein
VRVGADERVREGEAVARLHDPRQVLEVDLMADAGVRRDDRQAAERTLAPAEEGVALPVALELELDVPLDRKPGGELVDLHGVVDHELRRDHRIDQRRVAALLAHRVAHGREVDDRWHAREVLQQHAPRAERDLARGLGLGDPARDRLHLVLGSVSEDVLEQDAKRVREPGYVAPLVQSVEPVDRVRPVADSELRALHRLD